MGTALAAGGSLVGRIAMAALPVAAIAYLDSRATLPNIPIWYAGLAKPPLTPPNGVFAPAWAFLFCLMALAMLRILSKPPGMPGRSAAMGAFLVQLALNGLWSWAFFAARSPASGLAIIAALVTAIVATIRLFARVDQPAAWLLAPYLVWVLFATYLNLGVWWLNG